MEGRPSAASSGSKAALSKNMGWSEITFYAVLAAGVVTAIVGAGP